MSNTATAARTVTMKGGEVFRAVISLADLKIALADGFASFVSHTVREDGIVDALVRNGNFDGAGRGRFLMSARTARQLGALDTPDEAAPKPEKVVVRAQSMLQAQGFKLEGDARAALTAKADRDRAEFGETDLQPVRAEVRDRDGVLIGHLTFNL